MRIAIDLTALLPHATGVDNYLMRLVIHLGRIDRDNRYTIFLNYEDRRRFEGLLPDNFSVVPASLRPRPIRLLFQQVGLPAAARSLGVEIVHSPSFLMPLYRGRQRHVLTVYDVTFFTHPAYHIPLRRSRLYRRALLRSVRTADLVTVPSQFTRQGIMALVPELRPERLRVIAPGVGEEFRARPAGDVAAAVRRMGLPTPYILYVGTIEPRKNLRRLVESYRRLIADRAIAEHLVLAGRLGWDYDDLLAAIAAPALRGRVHLIGYVAQEDLPWLYGGARLFVYPSIEEGFGFPPLEAMACGVPTISSLGSSLLENLQGAAELVNPEDERALAAAMGRLLEDEPHRARLREQAFARVRQFRWEHTARQTLACYQELAAAD
jgi:glycosyltransferase involved in cell wall biosynthesis